MELNALEKYTINQIWLKQNKKQGMVTYHNNWFKAANQILIRLEYKINPFNITKGRISFDNLKSQLHTLNYFRYTNYYIIQFLY